MDIRSEREAVNVSQGELAKRIGMSQTTLSRIENGDRPPTHGEETLVVTALAQNGTPPPLDEQPTVELDAQTLEMDAIKPRLKTYPSAGTDDPQARRDWITRRNRAIQRTAIPQPASGTFGKQPKGKT